MSDPVLDLLAAPPSPDMSVDERSVYAGGRRRLLRRTLRRTGFGVGAAAAAAAVAFAVVSPGVGGEALPAGPPPPPTAETSVQRVSAELLDGLYAVEVIPNAAADQPNVIYYRKQTETGAMIRLAGSDASPEVVSLGGGSGAEGVMLGTAPASATAFLTITRDGTSGGIEQDVQPLPGTGYQAVALRFENPRETDSYVGTAWTNAKDEVRSATGVRLPSAKVGATDIFWVDRESATMGVFTPDGGSTKPVAHQLSTTMGYGQREDGKDWTWRSVTLLPKGSRDVTFTSDATTVVGPRQTLTTTGEVVAWQDLSAPGDGPSPRVTGVTWTDEAGTRHTDAVK